MSIATYAELKTAVANLLNRADQTSRIPEWIVAAETRINYGNKEAATESEPLRVRAMEQSSYATLSAATRSIAVPTRFLNARRFYTYYTSTTLVGIIRPIGIDQYWAKYANTNVTGSPVEYVREGESFLLGPIPDQTYTAQLMYWKGFAALSGDSDTNWLLTNAPYAYVHGAAIEGFRYLRDFQAMASSHAAFIGIINALNHNNPDEDQSQLSVDPALMSWKRGFYNINSDV